MITVSLKQILAGSPCAEGWARVLHARGKITKDQMDECLENDHVPTSLSKLADDEQFQMSSIIESNSLNDCIWTFKCVDKLHHPLRRKFAVWCARQVQHLMKDQRSIDALDAVWRHSDDLATDAELATARRDAADAADAAAVYAAAAADAAREKQRIKLKQILDAGKWVE